MKILAIDSSAKTASVAILEDNKVLVDYFINAGLTHSQTLAQMVESSLKNINLTSKDMDYFAVTGGPGSFTGVRIGISLVKGITLPLDKPCVLLSVLESIAYNFIKDNAVICAVMDAKCNQVYNALFEIKDGDLTRLCEDRAIMIDELKSDIINKYNDCEKIILAGDGADLCMEQLKNIKNLKLAPNNLKYQRASSVALNAAFKINQGKIYTVDEILPIYLRMPQAQRELNKKINKGELK